MIELKNVTFCYEDSNQGIFNVNLAIEKGSTVVLTGLSGCGKTTLTRIINTLIPHYYEGNLQGEIVLNKRDTKNMQIDDVSTFVGSVFQNPRSQFYNINSTDELVFQGENCGLDQATITNRLDKAVNELQLQSLMNRSLFELSGGEKQKIACASLMVCDSEIIVLDEPSSNLDVFAIRDLHKILVKWKEEGKTIIISEHRLYYLMDILDSLVLLKDGKTIRKLSSDEVAKISEQERRELGLRTLHMEELSYNSKNLLHYCKDENVIIKNFTYQYDKEHGIRDINFSIPENAVVGIIGHNGAGKSTFAKAVCGLLRKMKGCVEIRGNRYEKKKLMNLSYMVMQDVNHQLFTESVLDEVLISLDHKLEEEEKNKIAKEILSDCQLRGMEDIHPMALSGGQKQRVAIASAVASSRPILIFDEPTSGLDYVHMMNVADNIRSLQKSKTIFIITHDVELIMETCTHILHMEKGKIEEFYELNQTSEDRLMNFMIT